MNKVILFTAFLFVSGLGVNSSLASDCNRFGHLCEPQQKITKSSIKEKSQRITRAKNGKTAVVVTGLFGEFLNPMHGIKDDLRRKGYNVKSASFFAADTQGANLVVGHSMGCFAVQRSTARNKAYIDAPRLARPYIRQAL